MRTNRTPSAPEFDPFLLPTCAFCAGRLNLSHVEPADASQPERRIYRCTDCGAEQTQPMAH